ncbi:hypothetical protein MED121_12430 [Marinomonas sp. MED121]|nr:hypothetical protein MED121_12430 [Marinomonas sp. MED121]
MKTEYGSLREKKLTQVNFEKVFYKASDKRVFQQKLAAKIKRSKTAPFTRGNKHENGLSVFK